MKLPSKHTIKLIIMLLKAFTICATTAVVLRVISDTERITTVVATKLRITT